MKILYVLDSPYAFNNGCWYYRNHTPGTALSKRGHEVQFIALNSGRGLKEEIMRWCDTAVFSRTYPIDPLMTLRKFKRLGKKVVYEVDDDLWTVNPENPSFTISEEKRRQYEHLMEECDAITTTTKHLAKKLRRFNKNVYVCPNAVNPEVFILNKDKPPKDRLRVAYAGAASHWKDLAILPDVISELQKKYDFSFIIQGICAKPLESEMWSYERIVQYGLQPEQSVYLKSALDFWKRIQNLNFFHIPFYPPVMYPSVLNSLDIDIGVAPLNDNEFNHSKSCVKFYEYATIGAATLASKVLPYKEEVGYCAKNKVKDWVNKLERLLADKDFREKVAEEQSNWVKENRIIKKVIHLWEDAFDPQNK